MKVVKPSNHGFKSRPGYNFYSFNNALDKNQNNLWLQVLLFKDNLPST